MTRANPTAAVAAMFALCLAAAKAQDTVAPTITLDVPANGLVVEGSSRVSVSGEVTDTSDDSTEPASIRNVQYRIEGKRRWRNATLVTPGESTSTYFFRFNIRKRSKVRIYVRAYDDAKNESDIIGRRVRRERR